MKFIINKYLELPLQAKAGIWLTVSGFVEKGLSFLTVPILTRILSTSQYGIISIFDSWELLLSVLCTLNLFNGGFNNGMLDHEGRRDEYVSAIQGLITVMTFVWMIIYLIGHPILNTILEMDTLIVLIMFMQVLATAALSLWAAKERYEFQYRNLIIVTLLNAGLNSAIPIAAILLCDPVNGAEIKIITHALVIAIICGGVYIYNLVKGKTFFCKDIWKTAFLFNLPLLLHYLSSMVLTQADRIMIGKMVGVREAGIYSVAYVISIALSVLATAMNNVFAPWLYRKLSTGDYKGIASLVNMLFVGFAVLLLVLIAFAPECIAIFGGHEYTEAVMIMPSIASSVYFVLVYQIFANVEFYYRKNKFIMYASVVAAVLNILLNYIGIQLFGYVAAGYTTLICYIVFAVAHSYFVHKICKRKLPGIIIFDAKTEFLVGAGLVSIALIMTVLYKYIFVRYGLIALIVVLLIIKRKAVGKYIKIFKEVK